MSRWAAGERIHNLMLCRRAGQRAAGSFTRSLRGSGQEMAYEVGASELKYDGAIIRVRADTVAQPDGTQAKREVVEHTGSVAVVAVDDARRVLLIRQYRHPAGQHLWELPAGLCDHGGEEPLVTARRELAGETGWTAADWSLLVDVYPSPGISTERCRIYQARE